MLDTKRRHDAPTLVTRDYNRHTQTPTTRVVALMASF